MYMQIETYCLLFTKARNTQYKASSHVCCIDSCKLELHIL